MNTRYYNIQISVINIRGFANRIRLSNFQTS